jgi:hypothetical protein
MTKFQGTSDRKNTINVKQDGQCHGQDFNQAPPEYKSEAT